MSPYLLSRLPVNSNVSVGSLRRSGITELQDRRIYEKRWMMMEADKPCKSLMQLNVAGGECVGDLNRLEKEEGFCSIFEKVGKHGLKSKKRREMERR